MSIIQIMVTIIIVTILVTVILGVASYAAYWLRRGRRPVEPEEVDDRPRYFYRYTLDEAAGKGGEGTGPAEGAAANDGGPAAEPNPRAGLMPAAALGANGSGNGRSGL